MSSGGKNLPKRRSPESRGTDGGNSKTRNHDSDEEGKPESNATILGEPEGGSREKIQ